MSSGPTTYPRLVDSSGVSAVGRLLEIPATGLALNLELPQVEDAVQELVSALLTVSVPEDETDLINGLPASPIDSDPLDRIGSGGNNRSLIGGYHGIRQPVDQVSFILGY